jgi:predicted homoserine dehydrogenase-like protein
MLTNMTEEKHLLHRLKKNQREISVGLVGAGSMGKGIFRQLSITQGLRCAALVDIRIERAISCAKDLKCEYQIVDSVLSMRNAIQKGILAICEDGALVSECEGIEVLVESSTSIAAAGKICEMALKLGKHVVMMNSEADLIFGPYFMELAHMNQVTYTSCDGDQHGVLARLIDQIVFWGFDLVLAGNIKGFLDRYSNPTVIIPEADKRNLDYKMATAYTDGTKLSIEMALLANAYNLKTGVPGMSGPRARDVQEALHLFDLERIWQSGQPVVDYILGAQPGGGVFVIGRSDDPYNRDMMNYYKMGKGPFYLFYRPYHLCHFESMGCILEAVHERRSLLEPTYGFKTNVYTYAKRDLKEGEILDGIGGYLSYGMIENGTQDHPGLPICLSQGVKLLRDIRRDEKIHFDDVFVDFNRDDFRLFSKAVLAV